MNQREEEKPSIDELIHYGTKGMKWGVRKKRPVGRVRKLARAAAKSQTDAAIDMHKNIRDGKGIGGALGKLDKATWGGNGRFEAYHNKRISELQRSKQRIQKGELTAKTLIFGPQYTTTTSSRAVKVLGTSLSDSIELKKKK